MTKKKIIGLILLGNIIGILEADLFFFLIPDAVCFYKGTTVSFCSRDKSIPAEEALRHFKGGLK